MLGQSCPVPGRYILLASSLSGLDRRGQKVDCPTFFSFLKHCQRLNFQFKKIKLLAGADGAHL